MARSAARRQAATALVGVARGRALEPVVGEVGEAGVLIGRARRASSSSAIARCSRTRLSVTSSASSTCRTSAWANRKRPGAPASSTTRPARHGLGDLVDQLGAADLLDEARSKSCPTTAATRQRVVGPVPTAGTDGARSPRAHPSGSEPGLPGAAGLLDVAEHLDQEERVAGGDLGELRARAPGRRCRRRRGRRRRRRRPGPPSVNAIGGAVAAEVGERRGERVGASQLGVAVGPDDEQPVACRRRAAGDAAATAWSCRPSAGRRARAATGASRRRASSWVTASNRASRSVSGSAPGAGLVAAAARPARAPRGPARRRRAPPAAGRRRARGRAAAPPR